MSEIFHFPPIAFFLLLVVVIIISVCGFHLLSFSHRRIGFSPLIGTIKMRTPRQKRQKETVERKWPNNVDRKQNSQHETFSRRWPAAVIESSIVSCFLNEYIATRNAQLSLYCHEIFSLFCVWPLFIFRVFFEDIHWLSDVKGGFVFSLIMANKTCGVIMITIFFPSSSSSLENKNLERDK